MAVNLPRDLVNRLIDEHNVDGVPLSRTIRKNLMKGLFIQKESNNGSKIIIMRPNGVNTQMVL